MQKFNDKSRIRIRPAQLADIEDILQIETKAWGAANGATKAQVKSRIETFSDGNLVAVYNNIIVGYATFIFINYEDYKEKNWYSLTDHGFCSNHDPKGKDQFGVNLSVPKGAPSGTSLELSYAGINALMRHKLKRLILGSRIPRYYKYADKIPVADYVCSKKPNGAFYDPELEFYRRKGLEPVDIVPDYFNDPASLNYGVIVEMNNPFYGNRILCSFGKSLTYMFNNPVAMIEGFVKKQEELSAMFASVKPRIKQKTIKQYR